VRVDLLHYELPEGAIAQRPAERRDMARLMVVGRDGLDDRSVADWPALVAPGSLVVLNDTRVVRARLLGKKARTGGKAELLLVDRASEAALAEPGRGEGELWRALGKGLRGLVGQELVFGEGSLVAVVLGESATNGLFDVRIRSSAGPVDDAVALHGHLPIPPYIRRDDDANDAERYQTIYATTAGAIAAPTAGLHLTQAMLDDLARHQVRVACLTLHVGLGTFQPVAAEDLDDHPMHAEWMQVPEALVREVRDARERRAPVVAVGTTVVRALETAADPHRPGCVLLHEGETRLLIQPGYPFRVVDAMLTNFHLPRSTLLSLVAAFAGRSRVLDAYREAVRRGYRFYSYGDAMWIPARLS